GDLDPRDAVLLAGGDDDRAALAERLGRVGDQVDDRRRQLRAARAHRRHRRDGALQLDRPLLPHARAGELDRAGGDGGEIDVLDLDLAILATEVAQPLEDVDAVADDLLELPDRLAHAGEVAAIAAA